MDFNHLYLFGDAFIRGALRVRPPTQIADPFALFKGEEKPAGPLVFTHAEGGSPGDLVGTTLVPLYLLSDRVIIVLEQHKFTGWTTYPVEVYGRDGGLVQGYQGFVITGRCGPIDNSRSETVRKVEDIPGAKPFQVRKGLYFEPGSRDGNDVFSPVGTGFKVVVEAVKNALEKAKVRNVLFRRLTEVERIVPPLRP